MSNQITLKVTGMSCTHCQARVEKALKGLAGVSGAVVDLKAGAVTVDYNPDKVDEQKMKQAIMSGGYGVG